MIKYRADLLTTREAKRKGEERKIGRDDMIEKDVFGKLHLRAIFLYYFIIKLFRIFELFFMKKFINK